MLYRILATVGLLALVGCTDPRNAWPNCDGPAHPKPVANEIFITQIGTVVTTTGDSCRIEEIRRYWDCVGHDSNCIEKGYDVQHQCTFTRTDRYQPLMRRMVCSNGTSTSTISDDGTKFHHEVIQ